MSVDAETALYTELWRACAGPLVTVPRQKELVYYFPQGHIEQVFLINFFYSNALSLMFIFRVMQVFHRFLHFFLSSCIYIYLSKCFISNFCFQFHTKFSWVSSFLCPIFIYKPIMLHCFER